jgi:hypothetical protein
MGHSSTRAAMIYLFSTDERQRTLADAVDQAARAELRKAKKRRSRPRSHATARVNLARKWKPETGPMKIIRDSRDMQPDLVRRGSAPGRTRTCDRLLRRHYRPSAVQTCEDAARERTKTLQAVVR